METKSELRNRFKKLRNDMAPHDREAASIRICEQLAAFCLSRRIRRIGVFWPLGSEIDLRPFFHGHPEWTHFFPRVASTHPPRLVWGPEPLEPGLFGLMEPVHAQHFTPPVQLLVVPGLVFDEEGYRIGYGGGFYDALLERLSPGIITLGAAFHLQRCRQLPYSPQDLPVQGLMTEQGLTWFHKPGEADTHQPSN
jgi:5-formyltetrahydrofolate cyclo-ligase